MTLQIALSANQWRCDLFSCRTYPTAHTPFGERWIFCWRIFFLIKIRIIHWIFVYVIINFLPFILRDILRAYNSELPKKFNFDLNILKRVVRRYSIAHGVKNTFSFGGIWKDREEKYQKIVCKAASIFRENAKKRTKLCPFLDGCNEGYKF